MDHFVAPSPVRAPQNSGQTLVAPPWDRAGELLEANRAAREDWDYDVQGVSLVDLASSARRQVIEAALAHTRQYAARWIDELPSVRAGAPIFFAGHQPELFHPGVWLKNFAISRLANRFDGVGINLIIDADDVRTTDIRVPTGSVERPRVESIPYDLPLPSRPYEERPIRDRATFDGFGQAVARCIAPLVKDPLIEQYWPLARDRAKEVGLGQSLAQARHLTELQWGNRTLELPQSALCRLPSVRYLICHLFAHLPRFYDIYNAALEKFRERHNIRNHAQPMPNLETAHPWLEAPLWVWSTEKPVRRRLFVRDTDEGVELSDRKDWRAVLPLSAERECHAAVERLKELERAGVKLRTRALVTTLVSRLVGCDLFVHGIGGARYDEVANDLVREFFTCVPPQFMTVSGTLHLPIPRSANTHSDVLIWKQRIRDLKYHPEVLLDAASLDPPARERADSLIRSKRKWIETPKTLVNAGERHLAISQANDALQTYLGPQREDARRSMEEARQAERNRQILESREYAFCLYPRDELKKLLLARL